MRRIVILLLILPAALALAQEVPDDPAERARQAQETETALAKLREDVATLKRALEEARREESAVVATIADAERAVSQHRQTLAQLDEKRIVHEGELVRIDTDRQQRQADVARQQEALAALLRFSYVRQRQAPVRRLLQSDHAAGLARSLGYARLLQRARLASIEGLLANLSELAQLASAEQEALAALAAQRTAAKVEESALADAVVAREQALAALRDELADQGERIAALGRDERAMVRLLEQLRDIFADLPKTLEGAQPFRSLRGSLAWPVNGPAESHNGGLLIAAETGTPVRAIAHGRVAFADWLKGYGLLLIVDHGDGYMSLYGHNDALLASEGAWVQAGDEIASVGRSGGEDRSALHFELRERGRTVDARRWLRKPS